MKIFVTISCHHQFFQGCPVHDSDSWKCAKMMTNCSGELQHYHCIRSTTGEAFTVDHICTSLLKCPKGTIPIYDKTKRAISCELCSKGFYQPDDAWSDETRECFQKHACEKEGNKIECDMGTELHHTADTYCRCDARNNYVLTNWERRGKCVEWVHATCYYHPCPDGQERLLNYNCALQCAMGQKRDDNDICVHIGATNITTTPIIGNRTDKTSPKTMSTTPFAPTSAAEKSPVESISQDIAIKVTISALSFVIVILGVLLLVCLKCKCFEKCKWSRKLTIRRQSISDAQIERELDVITQDPEPNDGAANEKPNEGTDADDTASRETCLGDYPNSGPRILIKIGKIENAQIGDNTIMEFVKAAVDASNSSQPAKSNSSSSGNQDIKTHVDKEQDHPNVNPADCPGNFRKIFDETDAIYNMEMIVEVAKSVGIIRSPGVQGTGFRVGESYIITALHVVKGIINSVLPPVNHREGEHNLKILADPKVYMDFDFNLPDDTSQQGQALQRNTLRFNFEPTICYENEILDTAVLKLKRDTLDFPRQLTRFGHCLMNLPMNFVGHSEGKVKQSDKSKPREDVTLSKIHEYQAWSKQHRVGCRRNYRGYEGAENPSKILFDCTFSRGASGSPGFIISSHDHMPYVVTMLLCGYPDWLYDDNVSNKEKTGIQDGYTFEQGVRLTDVYKDMKIHKPELCLEIFGS